MDKALEDWFIREILVHEAALTRYLAHAWSNAADVPDLRQEIYIRVLEAAEKVRPPVPRYFLFAVARNLLTDHARRRRIVPIDLLQEGDASEALVDEVSPERKAGNLQQLLRMIGAFEQLPDRCREVMWLKKIEDLPQKVIAERLKIAEGTVEQHLVRGMRLLTQFFYGSELEDAPPAGKRASPNETRHG